MGYRTRAEQATRGLSIVTDSGMVRVRDGVDTWVCHEDAWDAAYTRLDALDPIEGDEGGGEAYTELCEAVKGPIASKEGQCRGAWRDLVRAAVAADLLETDEGLVKYAEDPQVTP